MTTADIAVPAMSEGEHRAQLRRAVIASTVGTTIEWYDFLLYGQVTGLVFGKLFFPGSDPWVGVLQAFAIFFIERAQLIGIDVEHRDQFILGSEDRHDDL